MSGFEPRTYTKLEISAATGFAPPEVDQIADFLKLKKSQYRDKDLEAFQQFQSMLKEQGWTINQAIAAHRAAPSAQPEPQTRSQPEPSGDAFNETYGHINREGDETSLSTTDRRAAQIAVNAQKAAGEIATATNLLTAFYLGKGNYDDPLVAEQVAQSERLLEMQIRSTSSTHGLGKLLAASGIPGLQTLPAIASASESLRLLGNGPD